MISSLWSFFKTESNGLYIQDYYWYNTYMCLTIMNMSSILLKPHMFSWWWQSTAVEVYPQTGLLRGGMVDRNHVWTTLQRHEENLKGSGEDTLHRCWDTVHPNTYRLRPRQGGLKPLLPFRPSEHSLGGPRTKSLRRLTREAFLANSMICLSKMQTLD